MGDLISDVRNASLSIPSTRELFNRDSIHSIYITFYPKETYFGKASAQVNFTIGDTSARKNFEGETLSEVFSSLANFCESL